MKQAAKTEDRAAIANRVSFVTLVANFFLFIIKLIAGILGKSNAMVADAVHTLSDVVSTIAVIIGIYFSSKPADKGHPYGHEKIESVVAKMLALMLMATAIAIGLNGAKTIFYGNYFRPGSMALAAAILSIISKEWMYRYTVLAANKINSTALKADAWHHRSDALSSIGTLAGIGGAMAGFEILDPIASLVVSFMIIKVAIEIYITGFNQVIDSSAPEDVIESIIYVTRKVEGVVRVDEVKTRMHASLIYVDTEISVDGNLTVYEGHKIAENVHIQIETQFPEVKHCMVHINPCSEDEIQ